MITLEILAMLVSQLKSSYSAVKETGLSDETSMWVTCPGNAIINVQMVIHAPKE